MTLTGELFRHAGHALRNFATVEEGGQPVTKAHVKPGAEGIGPLAGDSGPGPCMAWTGGGAHSAASERPPETVLGWNPGQQRDCGIFTGHLPYAEFIADPTWSAGRSGAKWQPITSAGVGVPETLTDGGLDAGNVLAVQDLLQAIADDRQPECSMHEGRTTIEMISAVFESHRTRAPVAFPLQTRVNPLSLL